MIIENSARRKVKSEPEHKEVGKAKSQITTSNKRIETTKVPFYFYLSNNSIYE